jgi:anthranilate synthase component 2
MRLLVVDNYDSFTWNLVHYLEELIQQPVTVRRNDNITPSEALQFDRIVLSPGPGLPAESGKLMEIIAASAGRIPLFGVCLGLQAIVEHYGGTLMQLETVMHGLQRNCRIIKNDLLFKNIEQEFSAGRYHSWVANPVDFPSDLEILAVDELNNIMAIRHKDQMVYAVQFHPESIMTPQGKLMLQNWLSISP